MSASIWEPGAVVPVVDPNSTVVVEAFVATAAQTLFNLTLFTYAPSADALEVYKNGLKLPKADVTETSTSSFTIAACTGGEVIEAVGNTVVASASGSAAAALVSENAAAASAASALVSELAADASADAAAASAVLAVMSWEGNWVTATAYQINDGVKATGGSYICRIAHTSGTFAADLAAVKWQLLAADGTNGTGAGDMLAANNLSDVSNVVTARSNLGLGTAATAAASTFATALNPVITGVLELPDGSAAAPSLTNTGDTNTGIYFPAADEFGVAVAGVQAARFTATGLALATDLAVTEGGTGASTAAAARTSLGAAASGANADITSLTALASINGGPIGGIRNRIINGGCQVAQRTAAALTSSATYGQTDRFYALCSGTGLSGNFSNNSGFGALTSTGCATWASINVTAGICYQGHRIEAKNIADMAGKTATFKCRVYHDFGTATTFAVNIFKATAVDNFTSVAALATPASTTASIPSGAFTTLEFSLPLTAADVLNGLQIQVYNQNAVTLVAKSFMIADWQLEVGSVATAFEMRPYGLELALCQRYYYRHFPNVNAAQIAPFTYSFSTTVAHGTTVFPVPLRVAPTALEQSGTAADYRVLHGATTTVCSAVPVFNQANTAMAKTDFTVASGLTVGQAGNVVAAAASSAAYLGWSAEL
jgi:hypothetical protein